MNHPPSTLNAGPAAEGTSVATALDVAAAVIERYGPVGHMDLQNLLFFMQGWSVVWSGVPAFNDQVEAWWCGPMVESVFRAYGHDKTGPISVPVAGDSAALDANTSGVLHAVLAAYGGLSAAALANLTYDNASWKRRWGACSGDVRARECIPVDEIAASLRGSPFGALVLPAVGSIFEAAVAGNRDAIYLHLTS